MSTASMILLAITPEATSHEYHLSVPTTDDGADVLRTVLGGWLQHIPVDDRDLSVWCDEDGLTKGLPLNRLGSCLITRLGGRSEHYVGTLLVTGSRAQEITSLSRAQVEAVLDRIDTCR
jgi:hypothetical protein